MFFYKIIMIISLDRNFWLTQLTDQRDSNSRRPWRLCRFVLHVCLYVCSWVCLKKYYIITPQCFQPKLYKLFHTATVAQRTVNLPWYDRCQEGFLLKAERTFALLSQDLAMYINEVKRDNETLKKISEFQSSIENLVSTVESSVISFCQVENLFLRLFNLNII